MLGVLQGSHSSIRTAGVVLWGLPGLLAAVRLLSGTGVRHGVVVLCVVVRARVRCSVCALPGLRVARPPCPGVLWFRRGETLLP